MKTAIAAKPKGPSTSEVMIPAIERPRPRSEGSLLIRRNDTIPRMKPGMASSGKRMEQIPSTKEVVAIPLASGGAEGLGLGHPGRGGGKDA
jgi:hypothetical protein